MTDRQTSPVGVKALRTVAEAFCAANLRECCIELNEWRTKGMLRDGKLRELGELCEKYVGCHDGLKNAEAMVDFQACALIADPTQPKAQVGSIDTPEFRMLEADFVKESVELSTKDHHADNTGLYTARTALIAHIDAWAGSRAGDAVPFGWKLVPIEPTDVMIAHGRECASAAVYRRMIAAAPAPGKQAGNAQEAHNRAGKEQG